MKFITDTGSSVYDHSIDEVQDIIISSLALSIAFTVALFGGSDPIGFIMSAGFLSHFILVVPLVVSAIVAKEMAQKGTARAFESHARYEMWSPGIVISVLSSFLGVVVAAVSGVKIMTEYAERYARWRIELNPKHMGIVASIGPLMSISLAMGCLMLSPLSPMVLGENVLSLAAEINAYIVLFSLVPASPLDGDKILRWSVGLWVFMIAMGLAVLGLIAGWI
ncbi:MAG: hypothetical protein MUP66_03625 [Candidatus Nanohaloarchaeota archaeon QJJ-5]|nr:hypothetical protein [Candidatus Nanohaloarchaeota archaeon QJJ-5]